MIEPWSGTALAGGFDVRLIVAIINNWKLKIRRRAHVLTLEFDLFINSPRTREWTQRSPQTRAD